MTQTPSPDCPQCAGTGVIPPFMDPCDCPILPVRMAPDVAAALDALADTPATPTADPDLDALLAAAAAEDVDELDAEAAEYDVVHTTDTVEVTFEAVVDAVTHELAAAPTVFVGREVGPGTLSYAADGQISVWTGSHWEPVPTEMVEPGTRPKTSSETFADLVEACDGATESFTALAATAEPVVTSPAPTHSADGEKLMTAAQRSLMSRLIAERDPANVIVNGAQSNLNASGTTGAAMTAKVASKWIERLMAVPADPTRKPDRENNYDGICRDCQGAVPARTGVIRKIDGRWVTFHRSGECLSAEAKAKLAADRVTEPGLYKHEIEGSIKVFRVRPSRSSKRLYAELVIPHGDGTATFAYNAKAMAWLRASAKLTWSEAKEFGAAYGACVACGRTLSDNRSLVQGYGNTCAGHYHWPTVTAKQAEAIIEGVLTWDDVIAGLIIGPLS